MDGNVIVIVKIINWTWYINLKRTEIIELYIFKQ